MIKPIKPPKKKRCKACKEYFLPEKQMQSVCDWQCAADHAKSLRIKREASEANRVRKEHKAALEATKPMIKLFNEAQAAFNTYIRERDAADNCISCGRWHNGQWHAGHFRTVGAAAHLRFNEDNVHKQCAPCNNDLSGNIVNYRPRLLRKIGAERLEAIENSNSTHKWTREELVEIKATYKAKLKELKKQERLAA